MIFFWIFQQQSQKRQQVVEDIFVEFGESRNDLKEAELGFAFLFIQLNKCLLYSRNWVHDPSTWIRLCTENLDHLPFGTSAKREAQIKREREAQIKYYMDVEVKRLTMCSPKT